MELHKTLIPFILELRKSVRNFCIALLGISAAVFYFSPRLLMAMQEHLAGKLYFFTIPGPFLAHVKLSFFSAAFLLMPWFLLIFWRAAGKPFGIQGKFLASFVVYTCLLFYAGAFFCYFITLPFGINFLLGYSSADLKAVISIEKFIGFVTIFILAFGLVFELPVFMLFFVKAGICTRAFFARSRRYALLVITILAAILTPTPDVFNMMLMAVPIYLLYESGLVIMKLLQLK